MPEIETLMPKTPDAPAMMAQVMADLGRSNPQLAMLAQMIQARSTPPLPESGESTSEEIAALATDLAETRARLEATQRQARKLVAAHKIATERLADLAAALGACGLCWGEDDGCPSCRGRGRVGMVRPDLEMRARLLGPPRRISENAESTIQN